MPMTVALHRKLEEVDPQLRGVLLLQEIESMVKEIAILLKTPDEDELDGSIAALYEYTLADEAYKFLPALLKRDFGLEVHGKLARKFVEDNKGEPIQINIIGEAIRKGNHFILVGESKSHLSKSMVEEFLNEKLKRLEGVFPGELFPIIVTHMISQPDVEEFALQQGIKRVYYSYEFSS